MTRVDFYVLGPGAQGDRRLLACRLADKAWRDGHRVVVHCGSAEEARDIDRLLWVFRDQSFIPHGLLGSADPALNPILIGHGPDVGEEHEVLINLASDVPVFFGRFERVAEPVDGDPAARAASRERYKLYRDRGYSPAKHDID
ncbi:MAG: DNA polymerase III subunit chi [Gammaproteobacteria bacterium]|nr:DNA polymerase III subunit chi [Gammaproteobacteria bacterium]